MIKKIRSSEQLNSMGDMIWKELSRFSLHDFCAEGGFTVDALQDFLDLAELGLKVRNEKISKKGWDND